MALSLRRSYLLDLAFGQQHAQSAELRVYERLRQPRVAPRRTVLLAVEGYFVDHPARGEVVVARRMAAGDRVIAVGALLPRASRDHPIGDRGVVWRAFDRIGHRAQERN